MVFGMALVLVTAILTIALVRRIDATDSGWAWLGSWIVVANLTGWLAMGTDKWLARIGNVRVPEITLWLLASLGGSPGVAIGMWTFRHKTAKTSFRGVLLAVATLQVLVALAIAMWRIHHSTTIPPSEPTAYRDR